MPYLSHTDSQKFISDCYHLLNEDGLLYISFAEGDPGKSNFQITSSGDRSYFYFYNLNELTIQLVEHNFADLAIFKVEYKKSGTGIDMHTIIIANKKTTA